MSLNDIPEPFRRYSEQEYVKSASFESENLENIEKEMQEKELTSSIRSSQKSKKRNNFEDIIFMLIIYKLLFDKD